MNHQNVNESTISEFELNHLDNCVRILGFANIYTVIKAAYDIAIWEDYTLQFNRKKDEIKIKCIHEKNQILNRIGQNRLERNIFSSKMMLTTAFKNKTNFYALLYSESKKKRKAKRLKWVKIIDNEIIYKLADGFEKESIFREILSFAGLVNYYSFIKNENLPDFKKINLHDILLIFTEVQYIFSKAFEIDKIEKKDESSNIEIFTQYRMKIKKHDLISYLLNKTKYSKAQIIQIIEIFIHKDGIFNIWEQPLHEIDNYLFPIMLPLTSPNTLRMIDFWLEKGGFNLEKRGKLFENHLIEVLLKALNEKGYKVNIPKKNIYKNRYGQQEEIDLIVELKNVTIIAEVKCIKYPFGPRDYHNMYKRLSEGAEQINRKATFINSNKSDFEKHSFLSKPLIKLVITNYPFFSGYKIKDVPIVDASLIDNYFINGALSNGKLITEKKKLQLDISINSSTKYYSNEDELSNNLSDFMNNPIPISKKINDVYIEENQISLPSASPKIVMDYVKFKHTNII
jgi:hypothetical protein